MPSSAHCPLLPSYRSLISILISSISRLVSRIRPETHQNINSCPALKLSLGMKGKNVKVSHRRCEILYFLEREEIHM
jgi:hypothetical protein